MRCPLCVRPGAVLCLCVTGVSSESIVLDLLDAGYSKVIIDARRTNSQRVDERQPTLHAHSTQHSARSTQRIRQLVLVSLHVRSLID